MFMSDPCYPFYSKWFAVKFVKHQAINVRCMKIIGPIYCFWALYIPYAMCSTSLIRWNVWWRSITKIWPLQRFKHCWIICCLRFSQIHHKYFTNSIFLSPLGRSQWYLAFSIWPNVAAKSVMSILILFYFILFYFFFFFFFVRRTGA